MEKPTSGAICAVEAQRSISPNRVTVPLQSRRLRGRQMDLQNQSEVNRLTTFDSDIMAHSLSGTILVFLTATWAQVMLN